MKEQEQQSSHWVHCPICGAKTKTKVNEDTILIRFPLYEGDKSSGHRQQKIDIYYTFIGEVGATQLVAQLELKGKTA